ncbi:carbohydrate-binding protein [Actinoplanes sp. NPDC023801]|uniref:carbohydrate-binding protein n=1 Tax=Actinoplanes sp. NPDC023801 TaxID=3154595 RepID=UPI00340AB7FD
MRGSAPRVLAVTAVVVTATLAGGPGGTAEAATVTRVVLSDDFTGGRGAGPDGDVWTTGGSRGFAWLDGDGRLALGSTLRTEKTFGQAYGRAEARIRMWRTDGAWKALGVLDAAGRVPAGTVETLGPDRVGGDDFHTYAVDWTPTTLTWSLDGRKVLRFTRAEKGAPLAFVLNLASAGRYSSGMVVDSMKVSVQVPAPAKWKAFTAYKAGQFVGHGNAVYRVREAHTSLPDWRPDLVPALFQKV